MIRTETVVTAVVDLLAGTGEIIGDAEPRDGTRWANVTPQAQAGTPQNFGGGEGKRWIRVRVSSHAVDPGTVGNTSRAQAMFLSDTLRARLLTGAMPTGDGWQVTGRHHDATATVAEERAFTVHDDYVLFVGAASPAP